MKKLFFLISIFATFSFCEAASPLIISEFSGLNTETSPLNLSKGDTSDSQNVITDVSPELQGRNGFLFFSSQPAVDTWEFPLSNGTRYFIKRSSNTLLADTGTGTFATLISTIPLNVNTVASPLGDKFYFSNTIDGLKYWDSTTVTVASAALTVNLLVTSKARLWASGKSGSERVIFVSKLYDGTSWTTPTNPSDDDPTQITVTGALDENIQALFPSFRGITIMWFKKNSFGGIYGSRRSNFTQQSFSEFVGASSPDSIRDCDGKLRWLANNRTVYEFDGATFSKISNPINSLMATILQGDSNTRTNTQTSQTDFAAGSISNPSNGLSTSISPGSVVLSTMAISSQVDTSSSDFSAGTLTNTSTTVINGSLTLNTGSVITDIDCENHTTAMNICNSDYTHGIQPYFKQAFTSLDGFLLTSVTLDISKTGSPGDYTLTLNTDNGGVPGTVVANFDPILASAIGSEASHIYGPIGGSPAIAKNTQYWIVVTPNASSCSSATYLTFYAGTSCGLGNLFQIAYDLGVPTGYTYATTPIGNAYMILKGVQYSASGTIVSRAFDVGFTTNTWLFQWAPFSATVSTTSATSITYQTQSSTSATGTFEALASVVSGSTPTSTVQEFIRYKASLVTTDRSQTPYLNDTTLQAGPFQKSSGTFTSQVVNVGGNITAWGAFTIGDIGNGGTIGYFFNRSTSSDITQFNSSSWTAITNGHSSTLSVGPYAAFRATFTVTNSTQNPTLNDATISWSEGSTIRAASQWFNQRYWLSVAISSSSNNTIFVYDRRNQWQRYVGINADTLGLYISKLMFANSSGIFQAETGNSDNGAAIASYYNTGLLDLGSAQTWDSYKTLYLTLDNSDSSIATTYQVNGINTDYPLGSSVMNATSGIQDLKLSFYMTEAQQGKLLSLKWTVNGTTFWRLIRGALYYTNGVEPD